MYGWKRVERRLLCKKKTKCAARERAELEIKYAANEGPTTIDITW